MNDDLRPHSNGRPMNVLVVDDDDGFRVVMERRLTASRHQVECVPSGEAALECLSARTFDVVLLDLRMPGLGGLETLKRIREADWPCEVVVLFFSSRRRHTRFDCDWSSDVCSSD